MAPYIHHGQSASDAFVEQVQLTQDGERAQRDGGSVTKQSPPAMFFEHVLRSLVKCPLWDRIAINILNLGNKLRKPLSSKDLATHKGFSVSEDRKYYLHCKWTASAGLPFDFGGQCMNSR